MRLFSPDLITIGNRDLLSRQINLAALLISSFLPPLLSICDNHINGPVAQRIEHNPPKIGVGGSSPPRLIHLVRAVAGRFVSLRLLRPRALTASFALNSP